MSADLRLPIDVIPGHSPTMFRWQMVVDTPDGSKRSQDCMGALPPNIERVVEELIELAKKLRAENHELHNKLSMTPAAPISPPPPKGDQGKKLR